MPHACQIGSSRPSRRSRRLVLAAIAALLAPLAPGGCSCTGNPATDSLSCAARNSGSGLYAHQTATLAGEASARRQAEQRERDRAEANRRAARELGAVRVSAERQVADQRRDLDRLRRERDAARDRLTLLQAGGPDTATEVARLESDIARLDGEIARLGRL
ncbi:hypothetical protein [Methylobrevis pamukkalensis]|uniref:Chromosome partition protein Smc n=1 Tax=Methylobrevis pamukkalensis TaxID=1439726 RepID=A0A1E3H1H3_9HYPH|nr:hypothetical protein [Methylobrevis pamukkalensis]ODN70144.1 hypothetical protein A6302_02524 [Methylobrevis pamukkalensis]